MQLLWKVLRPPLKPSSYHWSQHGAPGEHLFTRTSHANAPGGRQRSCCRQSRALGHPQHRWVAGHDPALGFCKTLPWEAEWS